MSNKGRPYYALFQTYDTSKQGFIPKRPSRNKNFRVGNEPGFRCPKCGCEFNQKYGVFGKFGTFTDPELHCLDCGEHKNFVKLEK